MKHPNLRLVGAGLMLLALPTVGVIVTRAAPDPDAPRPAPAAVEALGEAAARDGARPNAAAPTLRERKVAALAAQIERDAAAFFPCASAPWSEDNPHHLSHGLHLPGGWGSFVRGPVDHAVRTLGYRRVFFHLPFGKATGQGPRAVHARETGIDDPTLERWHMSADHEHDLRRTGHAHVARGFYAAMAWLRAEHPGLEVIVYVGSFDGEDERLLVELGEDALLCRWGESLTPLLADPLYSVVFDAAVGKDPSHVNARVAMMAQPVKRAQGRFVGVEARIQRARPWPNELGMTCVAWEDVFRRQRHAGNLPDAELAAPPLRVIDGRARALLDDPADPDAWRGLLLDVVREGGAAALAVAQRTGHAADAPAPFGGPLPELARWAAEALVPAD